MEKIDGLVAITGGIGSGKSVVSRILRVLGYPVYDCDSRAKQIMDCDKSIHSSLCSAIHPRAVVDGKIDRALISGIVFSDKIALARLNEIVHAAVTADLVAWCELNAAKGVQKMFVETAILRSSGLYRIVDDIWEVEAPINIRIERVTRRSGLSEEQIRARMRVQESESLGALAHHTVQNTSTSALLPQIHLLLEK